MGRPFRRWELIHDLHDKRNVISIFWDQTTEACHSSRGVYIPLKVLPDVCPGQRNVEDCHVRQLAYEVGIDATKPIAARLEVIRPSCQSSSDNITIQEQCMVQPSFGPSDVMPGRTLSPNEHIRCCRLKLPKVTRAIAQSTLEASIGANPERW